MAFDVIDWNTDPNQRWFVKLSDIGSQMRVELFNTQAHAQAGTNRVAFATVAFGAGVLVTLTPDSQPPAYGDPLAKYNASLSYHLVANGLDSDTTKIFAIGPFTDLPSIEDPLMLTEAMIQARGEVEINRGTHSRFYASLTLGRHFPALDEGVIVTLSSSRRGLSNVRQKVLGHTTEARIEENGRLLLFDSLETIEFLDFLRQ
jgi:hypothetical protein